MTKKEVSRILRGSYNSFGINRWWHRPRPQLDGKTPAEMWHIDKQRVIDLAESGRAQVAT